MCLGNFYVNGNKPPHVAFSKTARIPHALEAFYHHFQRKTQLDQNHLQFSLPLTLDYGDPPEYVRLVLYVIALLPSPFEIPLYLLSWHAN